MPDPIAYKIMSSAELEQMQRDGVFCGSPADIADGYIHLSCGSQLAATLDKHFSGIDGLMLVAVDLSRLWSEPLTEWSGCLLRAWMPCAGSTSPLCRNAEARAVRRRSAPLESIRA